MSGKTKIFVLHMREVIYTGIFIFLGLIFLILLAIMFLPKKTAVDSSSMSTEGSISSTESAPGPGTASDVASSGTVYTPGIYSATLEVSGSTMEMQLIIEQNGISEVSFSRLDETIETMYPLFTPVLDSISEQLKNGTALEDITYEDSQKYTASILLDTIEQVLETAAR